MNYRFPLIEKLPPYVFATITQYKMEARRRGEDMQPRSRMSDHDLFDDIRVEFLGARCQVQYRIFPLLIQKNSRLGSIWLERKLSRRLEP